MDMYAAGPGAALSPSMTRPAVAAGTQYSFVLDRLDSSLRRSGAGRSPVTGRVREVLVVASSSRSGSSLFVEMLRRNPRFLCLAGELNPYLRLAGLSWPCSGSGSDSLFPANVTDQACEILDSHLGAEVGTPIDDSGVDLREGFVEALYRRLYMQWPLERLSVADVAATAEYAIEAVNRYRGHPCCWESDGELFHALFLSRLRESHPAINPYYYDIDRDLVRQFSPDSRPPGGPPSSVIVEEPPFILIRPSNVLRPADLENRALVIKTPSNAYRIGFLRALFPAARFRILHLTRNPGAAINGICDGWRHWGFHSHYIGPELRLSGVAGADHGWWKFDLPPGWEDYVEASVEQAAAFQWVAAHRAILAHAAETGSDYHRVRFEDVLSGFAGRQGDLQRLRAWIGDASFLEESVDSFRHVMVTQAPVPGRWRARRRSLDPVLRDWPVVETAREIGYEDESEWV